MIALPGVWLPGRGIVGVDEGAALVNMVVAGALVVGRDYPFSNVADHVTDTVWAISLRLGAWPLGVVHVAANT